MRPENNSVLITIVDDSDVPIGAEQRNIAISKGYNHRTVHVIATHQGHVVLQKLSSSHIRSPGLLGSSAAGFVKAYETYEIAAKRIIQEELRTPTSGLFFVGKTILHESNYLKFLEVYSIILNQIPSPNPEQFSELIECDKKSIDILISEKPNIFAKTFLSVYPLWKQLNG